MKECSEAVKMESMRLYKRKTSGVWYISFGRGKEKSLKTGDEAQAKRIFKKVQEEVLKGRLIQLFSPLVPCRPGETHRCFPGLRTTSRP